MQNLEFGDRPLTNPNHRLFGFYQLLKQEGFPEQNIILQNSFYKDNFMPSSEQFDFMHGIIRGSSSPKYGFIYNDQTARMLVNLAIKYNRKLKKDLIILALGGLPTPNCGITPVMSSINAPLAKLSESALDMLYDLIDRKQNNCPNRQLHLNLQIHDT